MEATATTIANALGLVNPLEIDVGGIPQIRVRLSQTCMLWTCFGYSIIR